MENRKHLGVTPPCTGRWKGGSHAFNEFSLHCPPSGADSVHTLTCAIMLLNTDLHGQVRGQGMLEGRGETRGLGWGSWKGPRGGRSGELEKVPEWPPWGLFCWGEKCVPVALPL